MAHTKFESNFFKILEVKEKLNLAKILENTQIPVTFNQLMKSNSKFSYIFIFDEKSIEIPTIISFCNYFSIKLYKAHIDDIKEMKNLIKYSQMVCIPADFPEIEKLKSTKSINLEEDLPRILNI